MKCKKFEPFAPIDAELCVNCEKHKSFHFVLIDNPMLPYKQAVVSYLLEHGGIKSYYGSVYTPQGPEPSEGRYPAYKGNDAWREKAHYETCGINWDKTPLPEMKTVDEFAGTFDESARIDRIYCLITCNCGEYEAPERDYYPSPDGFWTLPDEEMTISNVILKVVKAGQNESS